MNRIILFFWCTLIAHKSIAQINATTSSGDKVILYENGSWLYLDKTLNKKPKIDTSQKTYSVSPSATFLLKSNRLNIGVNFDTKKWNFSKSYDSQQSEYSFQLKGKDCYAAFMAEQGEVPPERLSEAIIATVRQGFPDVKIEKQEYRSVNNVTMLYMQMSGNLHGTNFTYIGYYHTSKKGTTQLVAYTFTKVLEEYKDIMEEFINGLNINP
jgi:hypothetical protein